MREIWLALLLIVPSLWALAQVPADAEKKATIGNASPAPANSVSTSAAPLEARRLPKARMPTTGPGNTVLYSAKWCGYCTQAKDYLSRHKVAYQEVDIDTPHGKAAFAKVRVDGIPVLLVDDRRVEGFTEHSYDLAFATRDARNRGETRH